MYISSLCKNNKIHIKNIKFKYQYSYGTIDSGLNLKATMNASYAASNGKNAWRVVGLDENKTVINVYDILGNIVKSDNIKLTENFSKVYDFSSLASGSYIVIVTDGKQKAVARLIKL